MARKDIGTIFKVLADDRRRQMLQLLGQQERTVGELEETLDLSQSSTSQHLKLLHQAGLVTFRKHGNFRIYTLQRQRLKDAMSFFDHLWDEGLLRMKQHLEQDEQ